MRDKGNVDLHHGFRVEAGTKTSNASAIMALVNVALSIQSKEGEWFTKDVKCLRPYSGETILLDAEEFLVLDIAIHAGAAALVARIAQERKKRLSARALLSRGFERL